MDPENHSNDLKLRTKAFALRVIRMYMTLAKHGLGRVLGEQVLRSGTSVGVQYREAHRARSTAEFISKMECVIQELDETVYWLELLVEGNVVSAGKMQALLTEAEELIAIFVTSVRTAKRRQS